MDTRATWIKRSTLGSPILLVEDNVHPFTEEFGWGGLPWKWFAKMTGRRGFFGSVAALTENGFYPEK
jgi:hypothetical protein